MATWKYRHNTEIEYTHSPIHSLLLSSVFTRQQGLLGGAEAFVQKLICTEISDKQRSQAESEFVTCSKITQKKHNVEWNINDNNKFNEGTGAFSDSKSYKGGGTDTILYPQHATKIGSHNGQREVDYYQTSQKLACVAQVLSSICFGKAKRIWYPYRD